MKHKVIKFIRRFFSCCIVAVIVFVLSFPASADPLNYRDFEVDVQVDGDNDIVKCVIPASLCTIGIRNEQWQVLVEGKGALSYNVSANQKYYIYFWPMPAILSLRNIPDTTQFYFMLRADVSNNAYSTPSCQMIYDYYEGDKAVSAVSTSYGEVSFPFTFAADGTISKPSSLVDGMGCSVWLRDFVPFTDSTLDLTAYDFQFTFTISSLYRMQELTGETNELLDEVNRQLEEQGKTMDDILNQQEQTNEKLDDIISGGAAGDDLIDAGDKIEDAGAGMGDSLDGMQDYEDQYTGEIDNYMADILAGADINLLSLPLDFVVRYINKIVEGIPRAYMVVFTLPMVLGILFFFAQHVVRAPRPDPTGDIVTRETFTTTEILEGRGKGRSTTTRTTTTSVITGIERGSG